MGRYTTNCLTNLILHDNDGIEDWHALPFSGNIDWENIKSKLISFDYKGSIALEVGNKKFEYIKEPEKFLQLAVERAARLLK